jgi:hypothetical protein
LVFPAPECFQDGVAATLEKHPRLTAAHSDCALYLHRQVWNLALDVYADPEKILINCTSMWIAAAHRSVCALTVATALTVGVVSVPPPALTPRAVHVSDVMLAAASASSPTASVVNPVGLVLVPLVKTITFVELWAIVAVDIVAAPVLEPLYWFAAWATGYGPNNPISFIPRYLEMIAADLLTAIRYPFTGDSGAAAATGNDLQSSLAPAASMAASQQVDPSDVALTAAASPTASSTLDPLTSLQVAVDRLIRTGLSIIVAPVAIPLSLLEITLMVATGRTYPVLSAIVNLLLSVWPKKYPASASTASVAANREMSSAAADSADTSAPKPSVGASRRVHRAVPDQVSPPKQLAAQPDKTAARVAAKQADAQKVGTHRAERPGQGHGAPSAS